MREIDQSFLAETASVLGDVTVGPGCSFWPGASVRGDVAAIRFGTRCNVQDNATVHCVNGEPNVIGDRVTIAHNAVVHGRSVGDGTLIGMHATVMGGVRIGRDCLVAAGALLPPNTELPDGHTAIGFPAKTLRPLTDAEREYIAWLPTHYERLAARHAAGDFPAVFATPD